jgi:succinate dehydrogenase / fumarate reductase iron-sulfur subunit
MEVNFKIIRQQPNLAPTIQHYCLDVEPGNTILECLNRIKWELDGTLSFRKNCRNTICGSCGMRINGRSALACKENIGSELSRLSKTNRDQVPEIVIAPLGNMPVIKDLVVDMTSFWDNLERIDPYISTGSRVIPEREFFQTPEERSRLDETGNCIMCGACYSECNATEVNPQFVGPHALAKAQRTLADSRDALSESRLEKYNDTRQGVWGCTRCYLCNEVCPMDVQPLDQIGKIKQEILARKDASANRSIRHRKLLIESVKQGGWVDERKFGLQVMTDSKIDVGGFLAVLPLGLRMIFKGKFPGRFEPSEGTAQVRNLIESVQKATQERREV